VERRYVGIDLHRRRSVIYTMDAAGEKHDCVRIANDPVTLLEEVSRAGSDAEVVIEATYGWYWAVDLLQADGHRVHLAHPSGNDWGNRRVKNDERDARDLADLLRLGRLAEAWIAPPATRELRELVRYRAKLVAFWANLRAAAGGVRLPSRGWTAWVNPGGASTGSLVSWLRASRRSPISSRGGSVAAFMFGETRFAG